MTAQKALPTQNLKLSQILNPNNVDPHITVQLQFNTRLHIAFKPNGEAFWAEKDGKEYDDRYTLKLYKDGRYATTDPKYNGLGKEAVSDLWVENKTPDREFRHKVRLCTTYKDALNDGALPSDLSNGKWPAVCAISRAG